MSAGRARRRRRRRPPGQRRRAGRREEVRRGGGGDPARAVGAPADAKALTLLALVRYKLGRLEDAHATYREIAGAAPHDAGARRNLGPAGAQAGRIDEALPELEMAVRIAPGDGRAWSYLGYVYAKKGEVVAGGGRVSPRRPGRARERARSGRQGAAARPRRRGGTARQHAGARWRWRPPLPPLTPPMPPRRAGRDADRRAGGSRRARDPPMPAATRVEAAAHAVRPPPSSVGRTSAAARGRAGAAAVVRAGAARPGAGAVDPGRRVSAGDRRRGPRARRRHPGGLGHAQVGAGRPARAGAGQHASRWGARVGRRSFASPAAARSGSPAPSTRWLPLRLADDVLYVREDRVLAFEGR